VLDDVAAPVEYASSGWSDSSHTSWRSSRGNPPIQAILRVHIMAVFPYLNKTSTWTDVNLEYIGDMDFSL